MIIAPKGKNKTCSFSIKKASPLLFPSEFSGFFQKNFFVEYLQEDAFVWTFLNLFFFKLKDRMSRWMMTSSSNRKHPNISQQVKKLTSTMNTLVFDIFRNQLWNLSASRSGLFCVLFLLILLNYHILLF